VGQMSARVKTLIRAPVCKSLIYTIVSIASRMIFSLEGHCSKRRAFASFEAPYTLLKLEAFRAKLFIFLLLTSTILPSRAGVLRPGMD
jgi:hypothetical protein